MRFASVYQGWETLEDFEAAISLLKIERETDKLAGIDLEPQI
jgi:transcriptional regulator NrdR family protein